MRRILVLLSLLVSLALSAAGTINVTPARPVTGRPVTFTLSGVNPIPGTEAWVFHDGSDQLVSGSTTATHTYTKAGSFQVTVQFSTTMAGPGSASAWVTVAGQERGPSAPFSLTSLILRWKNGSTSLQVPKGPSGPVAYADIKFEGTGAFQAQWLVDGQVFRTVSQALTFAGRVTLDSGSAPALPANIPGSHDVTLRILNPVVTFAIPVIRYEVTPDASPANPPSIDSVQPSIVYSGEEAELQLTGRNLDEDMKLDFGSGIAPVGKLTLLSPTTAKVKVFVPPTVTEGFHALAMLHGKNREKSRSLGLQVQTRNVLRRAKKQALPCPDEQSFKEGRLLLRSPIYAQAGSGMDHMGKESVPYLKDTSRFLWDDDAPGASEYYELRFYDKTGTRLLCSERLPGNATAWDVPAEFVPRLVNLVLADGRDSHQQASSQGRPAATNSLGKGSVASQAGRTVAASSGTTSLAGTTLRPSVLVAAGLKQPEVDPHLTQIADVLWQVVGLRDYTCIPPQAAAPPPAGEPPAASKLPGHGGEVKQQAPHSLNATRGQLQVDPGPGGQIEKPDHSVQTGPPVGIRATMAGRADLLEPEPVKMSLEMAASGLWPLKLPQPATGIAFGSCSYTPKGASLSVVKLSNAKDLNTYPGDRLQLTGSFSLDDSPYDYRPEQIVNSTPAPNQYIHILSEVLSNVFVDWGDGSGLMRLSVTPGSQGTVVGSESATGKAHTFQVLDKGPQRYVHQYAHEGKYNVRVFMLSQEDVQAAGLLSGATAALVTPDTQGTDYRRMAELAIGSLTTVTPSQKLLAGGTQVSADILKQSIQFDTPSLQQVLQRAYILYCGTQDVRPFPDQCALKPLELVSVEVGFDQGSGSRGSAAPGTGRGLGTGPSTPVSQRIGQSAPGMLDCDLVTSACNEALAPRTVVRYFGHGLVKVVWKVDGVVVAESQALQATMKERSGLANARAGKDCQEATPAELVVNMPDFLPVQLGLHSLTAEAEVVADAGNLDCRQVKEALHELSTGPQGKVSTALVSLQAALQAGTAPNGRSVQGVAKTTLGVLNPHPAPGQPQYIAFSELQNALGKELQQALSPSSTAARKPPFFAASKRVRYYVAPTDPKNPCSIDFPARNGTYRITDLAGHVRKDELGDGRSRLTGTGVIKVAVHASEDTVDERNALPVTLGGWETDGLQVLKGEIRLQDLNWQVNLPGTKGTLDSLKASITGPGQATDMLARFTLRPDDATLTLRGNESQVPTWTVERPLSSEGDFYAEGLDLPETFLGRTPWTMSSKGGVVLDYSHREGEGPGGRGRQWVGVRLKRLALQPYGFGLVAQSTPLPVVDDWYLGGDGSGGLHGQVDFKDWMGRFQDGSIKVGTMHFEALGNQNYKSTYKDTEVQVPWLPKPIVGNVVMSKSAGGFIWSFDNLKSASMPPVVSGPLTLTPANVYFTNDKRFGWAVIGDAVLDFKTGGKTLASFTLDHFCYRFDGRASFADGSQSRVIALNRRSSLGDTPADLRQVAINLPQDGPTVADFAFQSTLRLSSSPLLPAADTTISYRLDRNGSAGYSAGQPTTTPFELAMAFPMGSPTVQGKIRPVYAPTQGGGTGATRYTGDVDLGLFGGPPVRAQFVLGYKGGKDYFLCRADVPLGPTGQVILPELLTLYRIHGGLGYNFGVDAFKDNGSILDAQPDMKGNALFSAGMRVGSSDGFIYTLDGTLTISTAAAARMDFDAWLLSHDHSGQGQLKGFFQYGNGSFDGRMWGGFELVGGLVQFSLGDSEANAAVDMHLGSDSWHIYAGQRNGSRLKAKVIVGGADAYLMLGSKEGLAVGGSASFHLGVGDSSVASAYVNAYMDLGLQITPQPRIIGDFDAGVSAGVCAFGVCAHAGVDASIHAEALPLDLRANCTVDLPWPLPDVSFTVHM